jgi:hypothetical protein
MKASLAGSLLCALALSPVNGHCGAPFETEDPNTVAAGQVELLFFYASTLAATGRSGSAPGLEVHLGVLEGLEIDLVPALAFDRPSGGTTQRGYGDTTLSLKYRVIAESEIVPLVSLVPRLTIPTGNGDRGLGNGGRQIFLAASLLKTLGSLQTYGNAGYWINNGSDNRNYWFLGWQAQYQFSDTWIVGAEIFHTTGQQTGQRPSTGFDVGGYYVINSKSQLLFSIGRGLQNAEQTNRVSAYAGIQLSL